MDYDYMPFHREKDFHNRCCGGKLWCIKASLTNRLFNVYVFLHYLLDKFVLQAIECIKVSNKKKEKILFYMISKNKMMFLESNN